MSLSEKAAYLRGLYDGMELGEDQSRQGKLLAGMLELLEELASHVEENEESINTLADRADTLLDLLEDEDDEDDDLDGTPVFEVECPNCSNLLGLSEADLAAREVTCPECGQDFRIEVEFSGGEDDETIPF